MNLFLDFESYYSDEYALSKMSMFEYVRDERFKAFGLSYAIDDGKVEWVTAADIPDFLATIPWDKTSLWAHNSKFDGFILAEKWGIGPYQYGCTKALSKAINGKLVRNHRLETLALHYGLVPKGKMNTKGLSELTPAQEAELAEYGKHDTELCRDIYKRMIGSFPANQLPAMDWTIRIFCWPRYELNVPLLEQTAIKERTEKEAQFAALNIPETVFRSQVKFADLLTQRGYKVPTKTSAKTGKQIPAFALGDLEFQEMLLHGNEELQLLCQARRKAKSNIIETRSAKYALVGRMGNWAFDVEFSGADQTHRFSGGDGAGGNPQNPTKGSVLRYAVGVLNDGYRLVLGDTSQIEARFIAYLAEDPVMIDVIETQPDLYCHYGSKRFGRQITKADKDERAFSKEAVLGLGYSMGHIKFKDRIKLKLGRDLSIDEAKSSVRTYREAYAEIPKLWKRLDTWISHLADGSSGNAFANISCLKWGKNYIELPSGLRMKYWNLRQIDSEKLDRFGRPYKEWIYDVWDKGKLEQRRLYGGKVLENICQALAGEHIKECLLDFKDVCVGQVHDELHLIVPTKEAKEWANRLETRLATAPKWFSRIKLGAEVKTGKNWGECK